MCISFQNHFAHEKEEYRKKVALAENFKGQTGVFSNERRALEGQNAQLKGMIESQKGNLELSYSMLEERKRERDDALRKVI